MGSKFQPGNYLEPCSELSLFQRKLNLKQLDPFYYPNQPINASRTAARCSCYQQSMNCWLDISDKTNSGDSKSWIYWTFTSRKYHMIDHTYMEFPQSKSSTIRITINNSKSPDHSSIYHSNHKWCTLKLSHTISFLAPSPNIRYFGIEMLSFTFNPSSVSFITVEIFFSNSITPCSFISNVRFMTALTIGDLHASQFRLFVDRSDLQVEFSWRGVGVSRCSRLDRLDRSWWQGNWEWDESVLVAVPGESNISWGSPMRPGTFLRKILTLRAEPLPFLLWLPLPNCR